jgi:acyl-CoA thioester hydrolase
MIPEHGIHTVSAQAATRFVKELVAGDLIAIDGVVTRIGTKSTNFHLRMMHADTGDLHATYDLVEVFFSPATRTSAPMPDAVRERLIAYLVESD